jgi:hypothetical protein
MLLVNRFHFQLMTFFLLQLFDINLKSYFSSPNSFPRPIISALQLNTRLTTPKKSPSYDKKKYTWKLLYAYMLGYEIDFGHIQAVNLCSGTKYSEKVSGYLACTLLLPEGHEVLRLIVNVMKQDIATHKQNESAAALALNTVANIGGSEMAENLFQDLVKLIGTPLMVKDTYASSNQDDRGNPMGGKRPTRYICETYANDYVRRKAVIALLRLYRKDTSMIHLSEDVDPDNAHEEVWVQRFNAVRMLMFAKKYECRCLMR